MNEQRRAVAERLAMNGQIRDTIFGDSPYYGPIALTEGVFGGKRIVGHWMPLPKGALHDPDGDIRSAIAERGRVMLIHQAVNALLNNQNIAGPKGKLPA